MLFKIANRIINTDNVTLVDYSPGADKKAAVLVVNFSTGLGTSREQFSGEEAEKLWGLLCAEARDIHAA